MTQMRISKTSASNSQVVPEVEKLVEYRTAHYSAHSEAAKYLTNYPARVQFRFSNPIVCRLTAGHKIMRVGGGLPFDLKSGDTLYVPSGVEIDIDLGAANPTTPIECDCFEIEAGRMDLIIGRLNESFSAGGKDISVALNWNKFAVYTGEEADSLRLGSLMSMFCAERDIFADARIEARIDETVLTLLHLRSREILTFDKMTDQDSGVMAAARLIRNNLNRHLSSIDLAGAACMSSSTLHRQFRKQFGTSPRKFANLLRIAESKRQLRLGRTPIESVSEGLAFSDVSHFTRVFRSIVGETPAEYRRRRLAEPLIQ